MLDSRGASPYYDPTMPQIREKLTPYDLHTPNKLAKALRISKQWAYQILNGHMTVEMAKRIAHLKKVDLPWHVVYEWKDGKGK